jgi:RNA polymerase sigma-70 factor (ECF subfamily)
MTTPPTDAELVARCRTGDDAAWRELVERFSAYVHAIAVRAYRLAEADAEEVFQEVFARAYEQLGTLRSDAAIRPWLGQLTRNLCVDRVRGAARELPAEDPSALAPAEVDDALDRIEEAVVVREALAALPDHSREVLDRFFARDESYRTIGAALGIPPGTIASRISRALAQLSGELEGRSWAAPPS